MRAPQWTVDLGALTDAEGRSCTRDGCRASVLVRLNPNPTSCFTTA